MRLTLLTIGLWVIVFTVLSQAPFGFVIMGALSIIFFVGDSIIEAIKIDLK